MEDISKHAPIPYPNRSADRVAKALARWIARRPRSKDYGSLVGESEADATSYEMPGSDL